ncbi:phosphate/phosphite/phosphonate ABC transporter substrate-binding protein [Rhodopila sp.]|uniref:phosphate/phosphite/phosphonate ABC transporter substrate-binding protein n=1 Tax=Rhodopila sp. TaxID=2480087 RepID=UPI003D0C16E9
MQMKPQRNPALAAVLAAAIAAAIPQAARAADAPAARAADAKDCPNDGVVRFGVEPFDTSAKLVPIYDHIGKLLGEKIGCQVKVYIATNYNAEIEAMRNGKLEIGEFGPLGYVLAHQVAKAQAVAAFSSKDGKPDTYWASLVTYPGSGIKTVAEIRGHSFAFSDPASTSGHLFPAYGLRKAGINPDKDIKALYAGSHTASYEALYNHKVDAGELNSEQLQSATQRGHYKDGDLIFLWKSDPIPTDPITVRGDLSEPFKDRVTKALQTLDLSTLPEADRKIMGLGGARFVPQTDAAYDGVRDLVKTLHIDLDKLS